LDALDDSERREFEEHLATCEQCRDELEGLRDAATALAYVPEGPAPPPALRERLLDRAHEERTSNVVPLRRRVALPVATTIAVAAVAAAVVLGLWGSSLSNSLNSKNAALGVLSNHASTRIPLGTSSEAVVAPDGRAVVVSGLAKAPSGKTYELWVIDGKSVKPAGLFDRATSGSPVLLARRVPAGAQIGLSIERAGGRTDHPTTIIGVTRTL
jgi:anti-sigma factor RsiW